MTKRATTTNQAPRPTKVRRTCNECGRPISPSETAPVLILSGTPFLKRRLAFFHKHCR
jgi:hypothetical protein